MNHGSRAVSSCMRYLESLIERGMIPQKQKIELPEGPGRGGNQPKGICNHKRRHDPAVVLEALKWIDRQNGRHGAVKEAAEKFDVPYHVLGNYRYGRKGRKSREALERDASLTTNRNNHEEIIE